MVLFMSKETSTNSNKALYLSSRFKPKLYEWDLFRGPAAGEIAPDFIVTDLDGNEVKLSDYRDKWVVIETGSATCSMYTKNIPAMDSHENYVDRWYSRALGLSYSTAHPDQAPQTG